MKKILLTIFIPAVSLFILVATVGYIKFNYFDVPYLGEPITYLSEQGESIVVSKRVDESIQLSLPNDPRIILTQIKSDSGERYNNNQKALVFWRKDNSFIVEKNGNVLYKGKQYNYVKNH